MQFNQHTYAIFFFHLILVTLSPISPIHQTVTPTAPVMPHLTTIAKWAYVKGLLPGHRDQWGLPPLASKYAITGAIFGLAMSILVPGALFIHANLDQLKDNGPIAFAKDSGKHIKEETHGLIKSTETALKVLVVLTIGAAGGACLGYGTWLISDLFNGARYALKKRWEVFQCVEDLFAATENLIPDEVLILMHEYKKDQDPFRLIHRITMAVDWYEKMALSNMMGAKPQ